MGQIKFSDIGLILLIVVVIATIGILGAVYPSEAVLEFLGKA